MWLLGWCSWLLRCSKWFSMVHVILGGLILALDTKWLGFLLQCALCIINSFFLSFFLSFWETIGSSVFIYLLSDFVFLFLVFPHPYMVLPVPVISSFIPICVWFAPHLMLFPLIMLCVHKPWVFPESLSVNSSMYVVYPVFLHKSHYFTLPLVSRVLPATRPWHLHFLFSKDALTWSKVPLKTWLTYKVFIFKINAVLLNFLFIK